MSYFEPTIKINGVELSPGQAMTVRVAIESFASSLIADGLGDDQIGKGITAGYLARITELRNIIFSGP